MNDSNVQTERQKTHQELCDYLHTDLWLPKNRDYGDSFHELYADLGIISAVTQIAHKFNRLKNIAKLRENGENTKVNESLRDTLLDMANYCVMTVMELDEEGNTKNESDQT